MVTKENNIDDDFLPKDLRLIIKLANESSRRTRWILIILITASCLALACFWNSLQSSWKHHRTETLKKYITYTDNVKMNKDDKIAYKIQIINALNRLIAKDTSIVKNSQYKNTAVLDSSTRLFSEILNSHERLFGKDIQKPEFDTAFLCEYYGKNALGLENLRVMYLFYWLLEAKDIKSFRIPFFDVSFDINDLGFIGGLGFSIILLIFYLSLIREKENIKIAFKASELKFNNNYHNRRQYYYLLSMNQLIIMPHVMNKKGKRYFKILPLTLLCFPFVFSFCVFINDIITSQYGTNFSGGMTRFEYLMSSLFLIVIIVFIVICFLEVYSIDRIWKKEKIWLDEKQLEELTASRQNL